MDVQSIRAFALKELGKDQLQRIFQTLTETDDPSLKIDHKMDPREVEKRLFTYITTSGLIHDLTKKYFGDAFDKATVKEAYTIYKHKSHEHSKGSAVNLISEEEDRLARREQARQYSERLRGVPSARLPSEELADREVIKPGASCPIVRAPFSELDVLYSTVDTPNNAEQYMELRLNSLDLAPPPSKSSNDQADDFDEGVLVLVVILGHLRYAYPPIKCSKSGLSLNNSSITPSKIRFCISQTTLTFVKAVSILAPTDLTLLATFHSYSGIKYLYAQGRISFLDFFNQMSSGDTPLAGSISVPLFVYGQPPSSHNDADKARVGALHVTLSFVPLLASVEVSMEASLRRVREILAKCKQVMKESLSEYDRSASLYMKDYLNAQPGLIGLDRRFVQLHALRDDGRVVPISTLIVPFVSSLLPTVSYCVRFVQLLFSLQQPPRAIRLSTAEQSQLIWARIMTTLCIGAGTPFDKAVLLCSMLRGYQIPAFVALGTCSLNPTKSSTGASTSQSARSAFVIAFCAQIIQFWDLSASDCNSMVEVHALPKEGHYELSRIHDSVSDTLSFPFETIDCIFNDSMLLSNIQSTNRLQYIRERKLVHGMSLDISKPLFWKPFSSAVIERVYKGCLYQIDTDRNSGSASLQQPTYLLANANILFSFSSARATALSSHLSKEIWRHIELRRQGLGLATPRSDQLSMLLAPTIASWEQTRLVGNTVGTVCNETFKVALKSYLSVGETLLVYPLQITGSLQFHAPSIMEVLLSCDKSRSIIEAHGDRLRFGLWVSIFGYAEAVAAVWTVIACCYIPVA